MPRYIAFLRAINVGGRNIKMERLRQVFESLGLARVETFIASGNVIFESSSRSEQVLQKRIESNLQKALGYEVATFIRSDFELIKIANHKAFPDPPDEGALYILFLSEPLGAGARAKVMSFQTQTDKLHYNGREIYWLCLTRFSDAALSTSRLERAIGALVTVRNAKTVRRLAAKCGTL